MKFLSSVRARLPAYPPYYEAPQGKLARMDQNVNLLGPASPVRVSSLDARQIHLYPSRDNTPLIEAAARAFKAEARSVFVANGSDEILDIILRTLVEPGGRVVSPHPSYSMYPHLCRLNRATYVRVPTGRDFLPEAEALLSARPDLLLLANPNNPTGTLAKPALIRRLLRAFDGPILVDEAYAEFADASVLPLVRRHPNLIVTRTLSKAAGLAGLRVGFGFAHPDVAELIRRNKLPFSVNTLSEQVALRALAKPAGRAKAIRTIRHQRAALARGLSALGFQVVPSQANFLLTRPPVPSEQLYGALKREGILARTFPSDRALAPCIRFTVGRPEDTKLLLDALRRILAAGRQRR